MLSWEQTAGFPESPRGPVRERQGTDVRTEWLVRGTVTLGTGGLKEGFEDWR